MTGVSEEDDDGVSAGVEHETVKPMDRPTDNSAERFSSGKSTKVVTDGQLKRLRAIQGRVKMPDTFLKDIILGMGLHSSKELTMDKYDIVCKQVEEYRA